MTVEQEETKNSHNLDLLSLVARETQIYLNYVAELGVGLSSDVKNLL